MPCWSSGSGCRAGSRSRGSCRRSPCAQTPRPSIVVSPARISATIAVFERPSVTSEMLEAEVGAHHPPLGGALEGRVGRAGIAVDRVVGVGPALVRAVVAAGPVEQHLAGLWLIGAIDGVVRWRRSPVVQNGLPESLYGSDGQTKTFRRVERRVELAQSMLYRALGRGVDAWAAPAIGYGPCSRDSRSRSRRCRGSAARGSGRIITAQLGPNGFGQVARQAVVDLRVGQAVARTAG